MKILCFFKREDGSVESELLEFHLAEKYKLELPNPKDPSKLKWQTFERGFVLSKNHGIQQIDTGLIGKVSNRTAAELMNKFFRKDRIAALGKKQFLLGEPDDSSLPFL
jgi:hypothetical protein